MIISAEKLREMAPVTKTDDYIEFHLDAIESIIRAYTNNPFQVRSARFIGQTSDFSNVVHGSPVCMREGDTVQISGGTVNDGVYVIKEVQPDGLTLNRYLDAADGMTVTKVQYPPDVVQCAVSLFNWKETMGAKVGIKSETLSRHSVTYEDSGTGLFMGYPLAILSGLKLYRKARC